MKRFLVGAWHVIHFLGTVGLIWLLLHTQNEIAHLQFDVKSLQYKLLP